MGVRSGWGGCLRSLACLLACLLGGAGVSKEEMRRLAGWLALMKSGRPINSQVLPACLLIAAKGRRVFEGKNAISATFIAVFEMMQVGGGINKPHFEKQSLSPP